MFGPFYRIRTRFALGIGAFLGVFASAPSVPASADPFSSPLLSVEQAVVPPDPMELPDDPGHGADRMLRVEVGPGMPSGSLARDPWAEALAEALPAHRLPPARPALGPLAVNGAVQQFIERFTGVRRDLVSLWLNRSGQYLEMIRRVLRAYGLPEDLAFVAMIESGFNPLAVSRAGAKGLWQFMATTARRYGLRVDQWVDERLDPVKSTHAAAGYLRDLYQQFGSWALAKAAYNAGEVTVMRAIRAVGSSDFWVLARSRFLRQETKEFVPAVQAAILIGRDPASYGFEPPTPSHPATATVRVPGGTHLERLATAAALAPETLRALNPVLIRGVTPPGGPWEITVPIEAETRIAAALASRSSGVTGTRSPGAPETATVHVVRRGETVSAIARRYGVSVAQLQRWNDLDPRAVIRPGDRLRVAALRVSDAGWRSGATR
jgi:membrane-bound lytic murein transglycosylase D